MRLMNAPASEPDEPSKDDFVPSFRYWIILKMGNCGSNIDDILDVPIFIP